jgi:hypothetical protein
VSFIGSGIDRVRAFGLAAGVGADGRFINSPLSVLIKWHSEHKDKLHQVYVDAKFAGVTWNCLERIMVVAIPSGDLAAARIEVYAVEPSQSNIDFSEEIGLFAQAGRVRIEWPRYLSLPFVGHAQIYSDGGEGEIDYDTTMNSEPIQLWPAWQDKGGFGMSRFGQSDFGFDGSAAVGFGNGSFGYGEYGFDADLIVWDSVELETGLYQFGVKVMDRFGNYSDASETGEILVVRPAQSAEALEVDSYDQEQNKLLLSVR